MPASPQSRVGVARGEGAEPDYDDEVYREEEAYRLSVNPLAAGSNRAIGLTLAGLEIAIAGFISVWSGVIVPDSRVTTADETPATERIYTYQLTVSVVNLLLSVVALVFVCSGFHRSRKGSETDEVSSEDGEPLAGAGAPRSTSAPIFVAAIVYFCKLLHLRFRPSTLIHLLTPPLTTST